MAYTNLTRLTSTIYADDVNRLDYDLQLVRLGNFSGLSNLELFPAKDVSRAFLIRLAKLVRGDVFVPSAHKLAHITSRQRIPLFAYLLTEACQLTTAKN